MNIENEDFEAAVLVIDLVLEGAALKRFPKSEGQPPRYHLSLENGETLVDIARIIAGIRQANETP